MNTVVRVKNIEIKDLKNIRYGKIITNSSFDKIDKADMIGIYGQNGSGKTAAIEAFSLLKTILTMKSLPKNSNHLIYFNQKQIQLSYDFIIENKYGKFEANYNCILSAGKEKLIVIGEHLSYRENLPYYKPKPLIVKSDDNIKIRNTDINDLDNESKLKIMVAKKMAMEKNTSFVFSKDLRKILKMHFSKIEMALFINIFYDFNKNFHIIGDMQTGLILANIIMPFTIHLKNSRGKIPYGLTQPIVLRSKAFSAICSVMEQINVVLNKVIPGLQILVNPINTETMENGEKGTRFEFLSIKDDKKLPLRCESAGVLKLISILSTLIAVFNNPNSCVVIDELDSGVFEFLLGEILEIININGKGQLFFTSHNLRALEVLPNKNLLFTTTNEFNRFIQLKGVKKLSNSRDIYIRAVQLGGQAETLYRETDIYNIKKSFRKAGKLDV